MERNQDNSRPPPLALNLFGPLEVRVHGTLLPRLRSRKGLWLLALLTLRHGKPVERDWLVSALWPDSGESQALAYLRQSLTELRHALATEAARLQTPTRHTLALDLTGAEVDVLTFDAGAPQADPVGLRRAVEVYRGSLLEGCTEEWVLQERALREQSYLTALQRLAEDALTRGDAGDATGYLRRVVTVDPLQEGAQRALMQALVLQGDYAAATQVYRDLRLRLHRQLNAEPDPRTTALYSRLRAQTRQKAQTVPEPTPRPAASPAPCWLPRPLTELLGREALVLQIAARLGQRRLLTLTGIGGVGKTRLAVAVAQTLVDEYPDGVWFVELAGGTHAPQVVQSVATTLGVREEPGRSLQETLVDFLQSRLLLLVLDNCEHLLPACAQLADELLARCAGVRILATSRQALGITGEVSWQVPSLPVPDLAHLPEEAAALLGEVSEWASVQLFVERAEAVQKAFVLTPRNARAIAGLCVRLEGIPLAIELAAGNVKVLPIEQIVERLDDVLRLLTRGSRTALPHQQTLRAMLDWSYALLTEPERWVLRRLAVFSGGWSLAASEQVCADTSEDALPTGPCSVAAREVLDVLSALVDKSLVQVEEQAESVRYRLLEPVRQYAAERLDQSGEGRQVRSRHGACFLALAEAGRPHLMGADQAIWLDRLEAEHDNLRAALAAESGEAALLLAGALWRFWMIRGYLSEGRERLAAALSRPEARPPTGARAKALNGAGTLARQQGDYSSARMLYEESLAIWRELADRQGIATSLGSLGSIALTRGDYAEARTLYEESLTMQRELGDRQSIASLVAGLGAVTQSQGDYAEAQRYYEESLVMRRELGDRLGVARSLGSLGGMAISQGDYLSARRFFEDSIAVRRDLGDRQGIAWSLDNLGAIACALGDHTSARALYEESLKMQRELGDRHGIAGSLYGLGAVAQSQGDCVAALSLHRESLAMKRELGDREGIGDSLEAFARLAASDGRFKHAVTFWATAASLRETLGISSKPTDRADHHRTLDSLRESLPERIFAEAWAEGCSMPLEQAVARALEDADHFSS